MLNKALVCQFSFSDYLVVLSVIFEDTDLLMIWKKVIDLETPYMALSLLQCNNPYHSEHFSSLCDCTLHCCLDTAI